MKASVMNSALTRVVSSDENPNPDIIRLPNYKAEVSSDPRCAEDVLMVAIYSDQQ
jgi:hypothetical protein